MPDSLINHIKRFIEINEEQEKILLSFVEYKKINKKTFLLKEGQVCENNYFILKGCLRLFLNLDSGYEHILQFAIENWWITDFLSMQNGTPSKFNIQAIENSEIIFLNKNIKNELFERIPKLESYFRIILEKAYSAAIMRIHFQLDYSGEERFMHFNRLFPDFVQRVPQYMLASYLGFTPEFLSKVRGKKH